MKTHQNKEKELAKQIILEIVRQAGGVLDNKTNLFKAFYHAHLRFAEMQAGYLSTWPIVRMPRGPGIDRFDLLLGELLAQGKIETKEVSSGEYTGFRFVLTDQLVPNDLVPEGGVEAIAYGVDQVRGKSAEQVSKESHQQSRSWRNASDGDELNIYVDPIPEEEHSNLKARIADAAGAFSDWR